MDLDMTSSSYSKITFCPLSNFSTFDIIWTVDCDIFDCISSQLTSMHDKYQKLHIQ